MRMYEVYMLSRPVLFIEKWTDAGVAFVVNEPNDQSLKDLPTLLRAHRGIEKIVLTTHNLESLWIRFCLLYSEVLAAGCVVENQRGEVLWIERNGKWDLPKGKVEPGESLEEAAKREVEEETGIGQLSIASDLGATYHTYEDAGTPVLKTTFWFHAKHSGDRTKGQPQKEEGITAVSWHAQPIPSQVLSRAYPSLIGLLDKISVSG